MQIDTFVMTVNADGRQVVFDAVPMTGGRFEQDGLLLDVQHDDYTTLRLTRSDGAAFNLTAVTYDIAFPLTNAGKIIVPDTGRHYMNTIYPRQVMFKHEYLVSSAHMSTPFFAYLDNLENVTLAFGLMGKIVDTAFRQMSPAANRKFSLVVYDDECRWRIRKPYHEDSALGSMTVFEDGFYQHSGDKTWFHALRRYAQKFQARHRIVPRPNQRSYHPQFCTWRVINSDGLNHDWSIATAKECKQIGLKNFIFDDGWYGVGLDSDIMTSDMGDWPQSVHGKYPDIRETVQAIKDLGLHPILWYCPTGIGPQSQRYERAKPYFVVQDGKPFTTPGLFSTLCPRNPQGRAMIMETLRQVLSYQPDGIKPDLFNYMPITPCESDHEHDIPTFLEATKVCFEMMQQAIDAHDPEMVSMAKNDEANVDFCQYAPSVRSGDSPYDPNIMFLRTAYPNAFARIVVNDYLMLAGPETTEEIARCLIKQVTMGVPAVSIDLLNTSAHQKAVLKAWIGFYNQTLMAIHKAAALEPQNASLTCWQRLDHENKRGYVSVVHPERVIDDLPDMDRLYILNASSGDALHIRDCRWRGHGTIRCFDHMHVLVREESWNGGHLIPVPESGYSELKKRN